MVEVIGQKKGKKCQKLVCGLGVWMKGLMVLKLRLRGFQIKINKIIRFVITEIGDKGLLTVLILGLLKRYSGISF